MSFPRWNNSNIIGFCLRFCFCFVSSCSISLDAHALRCFCFLDQLCTHGFPFSLCRNTPSVIFFRSTLPIINSSLSCACIQVQVCLVDFFDHLCHQFVNALYAHVFLKDIVLYFTCGTYTSLICLHRLCCMTFYSKPSCKLLFCKYI